MPKLPLLPILRLLAALSFACPDAPGARETAVPEPLRPWKAWVLDKHPEQGCPAGPDGRALCVAFGILELDLGDKGGSFVQAVTVYGNQWVALPGNESVWPRNVKSRGGGDVPVVPRDGIPQARLSRGEYLLAGSFAWTQMPAVLQAPVQSALLSLRLRGREVAQPERDASGRLLLGTRARPADTAETSPLTLRVFRKLIDDIPMRLETRITLSVSGREREILTGRLLPAGSAPLSIDCGVPCRVEPDGRLRAQIRSGDHALGIVSRFLAPTAALAMVRLDSLWPEEEVWTFEARRDLRVVELRGAPLIDASQTGLPGEWQGLPAYRLRPGDTLRIEEKQRGDVSPQAGDLQLRREIWLDFSGRAYTLKDVLAGRLYARSRLEMRPGFVLGRAELGGAPVMISALDSATGVEAPAGPLQMTALSRAARKGGSLEATGWNQVFQSAQVTLHLPPGWKLLHADGPDRVGNSWVGDWSLWDVFLLCILTVAVLRLAGWPAAALALAGFTLLSQEPGLPGYLWLNLLAALALARVLPAGRLRAAVRFYRTLSVALLLGVWIPFAIVHARKALYPQLDGPGGSAFGYSNAGLLASGGSMYRDAARLSVETANSAMAMGEADEMAAQDASSPPPEAPPPREESQVREKKADVHTRRAGRYGLVDQSRSFAPQDGKVQTGPGEPEWGWETAQLSWSGPVQEGEILRLTLMRPWVTRLCRVLQALLPGLLLLLLAFPAPSAGSAAGGGAGGPFSGLRRRFGSMLLLALLALPARAEYPGDALLQELERRLLAPPACAPACGSLNSGAVTLAGERLRIHLVFDAADTAVVLLPQSGSGQMALEALRLGDRPAASAARLSDGRLAMVLPRGRHSVVLEGRVTGQRLELAFGEGAHNLSVSAPGYAVQGLNEDRAEGGTLVFQRREAAPGLEKRPALMPDPIPPFVEVHRTVSLGQEWILFTRVVRVAPGGGAFAVEVPLLPFEHPVTPGMARETGARTGRTLVSFQEGQQEAEWRSTLDRLGVLRLAAGDLAGRAEIWRVEASSRWHVETSGPAPVQPPEGSAETLWRPLPGDSLFLAVSEPMAASGPVKTVESAVLNYRPGRREGSATLTLRIRAGQGDATRVLLPPGAELENLAFDGNAQPLTQREGTLILPLHPGLQEWVLTWKQPEGIGFVQKTPRVELGDPVANISPVLSVPADRWILWVGGPSAGPALLLWGVLAVLTGLAWLLGRSRATPLGFADWALLFAGTSTVNVYAVAPLLLLFLALREREKRAAGWKWGNHNLAQIGLAGLGLVTFGLLVAAVPEGLLSVPDMQVTGNGSHAGELRWFLDRSEGALPRGWMFSVPLWVYRLAMLSWSLWLAFRLLRWLRWSWERLSAGGLWRERPKK